MSTIIPIFGEVPRPSIETLTRKTAVLRIPVPNCEDKATNTLLWHITNSMPNQIHYYNDGLSIHIASNWEVLEWEKVIGSGGNELTIVGLKYVTIRNGFLELEFDSRTASTLTFTTLAEYIKPCAMSKGKKTLTLQLHQV